MASPADIVREASGGGRRQLARAITLVEAGVAEALDAVAGMRPRRRSAPGAPHVIGLTGAPGAGKSTLVDGLIGALRDKGLRVGVVAVDPSSPRSGGAVLGDRIRMERHVGDDGVFIRSVASRGYVGGLSATAADVVDLLDVCGYDVVLVETVGVGQAETAVVEIADSVVVVLTPESGDAVQAMKAGILELADVFVVNKSDRPGADAVARELEHAVALGAPEGWVPPVLATCAAEGRGIAELVSTLSAHLAWLVADGRAAWAARRGEGRLRHYLDTVADSARRGAAQALDPATEQGLRSGAITVRDAVGRRS